MADPVGILDELAPDYVGRRVIVLAPSSQEPAQAFSAVDLDVSLDPTGNGAEARARGLKLPLELLVTGPSGVFRHVYRHALPVVVTFTPQSGGEHNVLLREVGHNHWWGALLVPVVGDKLP